MPEGEEEEQEIENLFEDIMKEHISQSGKGNKLPGTPGISGSPKKVGPKETHTNTHHNYITQDERYGENLKSSKRRQLPTKEFP